MAERENEPQSYGSQNEDSERGDFYANGPTDKAEDDDDEPTQKITSQPSGAKRDSYFKKRDY